MFTKGFFGHALHYAVLILSTLEAVEQCVIKSLKFRLNSWVCGSALTAAILEGYITSLNFHFFYIFKMGK